jgi:patatin-like phospholipase/acyl hydrolase
LIAGTSTGAIIAAGIASNIAAGEIVDLYKEHAEGIFKPKKFSSKLSSLRRSEYKADYLHQTLYGVFGEKTLGQLEKPLLIPSTDIGNGCVHVFKSGYLKSFVRDANILVSDAVLASCSAPTYFDPHKIDSYLLADGGLWANNPSLAAVIDAEKRLGINRDDIQILTIGTGHSKTMYGTCMPRKWGFATGWKHKEFIGFILSLQSQSALNYLNLQLRSDQIKRIDFESDMPLELDDVGTIDDLISRANRDFTHNAEEIKRFIDGGESL